ncbi:MAG TPA: hypothetical protein VF723_13810 [Pyrinomonadaceae bacterium]|jgi:outer membrane lipoprotein-sorting protein
MKIERLLLPQRVPAVSSFALRRLLAACLLGLLLMTAMAGCAPALAQQKAAARPQKLPSPERVIGDYLKALGGKKRQAEIRDALYEWTIQSAGQTKGSARTRMRAPGSARLDIRLGREETSSAVSPRSAWTRSAEGSVRTLTDAEAGAAKLQAALDASRLVELKKSNVMARTVALDQTAAGEPAYVLEFSTRAGARLRYWFGANSKLLLKAVDDARRLTLRLDDYRRQQGGPLEPHRVEITRGSGETLTLLLQAARYNTGLSDALFDPPAAETLDIATLLREVEANQKKIDERVTEYAFTQKVTERNINDRGEVTKEKVSVYEIYPLPGGTTIAKLISENGVALTPEKAAKQQKSIEEFLAKYEKEREERQRKEEAAKNSGQAKKEKDDDDVTVAQFLRACEFVSPRRERLRDREAIVFDFRPRQGFRPKTRAEEIITKLTGVVWIDPADKTVIRLEAKLAEGYKMGGGLVASIRPGSAFAFEQTRMADGVWLPRGAQINIAARVFLFKGIEANQTFEFSDYRRFDAEASDYKLTPPVSNAPIPLRP